LPVKKDYLPEQELELEIFMPEKSEPVVLKTKVKFQDGENHLLHLTLLADIPEVFNQLGLTASFPPGDSKARLKLEELEELLDAELEPKVKIELVDEEAEMEQKPEPEVVIKPHLKERDRLEEKPAEVRSGQEATEKQEVEVEFISRPEKKEERVSEEEPAPQRVFTREQKEIEPEAFVSGASALSRLRFWLEEAEPGEKKEIPRESRREREEVLVSAEPELKPSDYGVLNKFVQSLVRAMLRSGYYSPEHPGSTDAKQGLYQDFLQALGDSRELGFTIQHRVGAEPEIFLNRAGEEPVSLKKILGAGASELFFPRYRDYFERKKLISFSIKNSISQEKFERFIDIMSDPSVDKGEEAGRLLTRQLASAGISEISAVFEDDLIVLDARLPFRVEMAIQRLAKDLKMIPLYQGLEEEELHRLKAQIVQDILRPLRRPDLLKDIVLNAYLIARAVPEIDQQELESSVIDNFPMEMLISCSRYISEELNRLSSLKPENEEEKETLEQRIQAVRGILRKIAQRVVMEEVEGAEEFLEELFEHKILTYDQLPPAVRERINQKKMVLEFEANPNYWLGKALEAHKKEELELFIKFFQRIIPSLIERKNFQGLYLLSETLVRISQLRKNLLVEMGIENLLEELWQGQMGKLIQKLLEEPESAWRGIEAVFSLFSDFGLEAIYQQLVPEKDSQKQKKLFELILKLGEPALERVRSILWDPTKPVALQVLALQALGKAGGEKDKELIQKFLRHSQAQPRAEAITALVRLLGKQALGLFEHLYQDPDPLVKKRLVAVLSGYARELDFVRERLREIAFNSEEEIEVRAFALKAIASHPPEEESERKELVKEIFSQLFPKMGLKDKFRKGVFHRPQEDFELKEAGLELLGKIGDSSALERISRMRFSDPRLSRVQDQVLSQIRLRLQGMS